MDFEFIFNHAPEVCQSKFTRLAQLRERPDFHPEASAAKHIEIVTNRCIATGDPNLIMTGFFHDIFKAETARINPKNGHPTCPGHDAAAERFIRENVDVQNFIKLFKADVDTVAWLCGQHMRIAQINAMRPSKQAAFRAMPHFGLLEVFHVADDMLISNHEAKDMMFGLLGITPSNTLEEE
jgi:hypothetical protein